MDIENIINGLKNGETRYLSKAITLIESTSERKRELGTQIVESVMSENYEAVRLGITGPPGTGKSTFIDCLGEQLVRLGHKVAVLAVDPSSSLSKGSILGDKTRMEKLSIHPSAYIRPSPNSNSLGGVGNATRESILLCEAAGYNIIMIETVGVGQSEFLVRDMCDYFLLLAQPGSGDDLQGIKKGIIEIADFIAVTKMDGITKTAAKQSLDFLRNALAITKKKQNHLSAISSVSGYGVHELWTKIESKWKSDKTSGKLETLRIEQTRKWIKDIALHTLIESFKKSLTTVDNKKKLSPYFQAKQLINDFLKSNNENPSSN